MINLSAISVRYKLLALSFMLVVGTGALLGLLAERYAREALEAMIGRHLAREASNAAERLSDRLDAELRVLVDIARQPVMRELVVQDVDKNIARALAALRADDPLRIGHLLLGLDDEAIVWDAAGRRHASHPLIHERAVDAPRVLGLAQAEGVNPSLLLGVPVDDPDRPNERLGTLFAMLDWNRLVVGADALRLDLDRQGISALLLLIDGSDRPLHVNGPPEMGTSPGALPLVGWRNATRESGFASGRRRAAGSWAARRCRLRCRIGPCWSSSPSPQALAPVARLQRRLVLMTMVAVSIGLVLATFSAEADRASASRAHRGDAPVSRVRRLRGGEQVPVRSGDELGVLASAFNAMAGELDEVQRELVETEKFALVGEGRGGRRAPGAHLSRRPAHPPRRCCVGRRRRARTADADEMLEMIIAEVDRLSGVVDDLLGLDHGAAVALRADDLREPIRAAVAFVQPQAAERGVAIDVDLPATVVEVSCDRAAIEQVCINLLSNALACLESGDRVEVRIARPDPGRIVLTVRDDGPGVPAELAERIFDPFVTGRAEGVGLGLTFVKRIVTAHQWTIELEPHEGSGAWFRIVIPVRAPFGGGAMKSILIVDGRRPHASRAGDARRADGSAPALLRVGDERARTGSIRALRVGVDRPQDARHGRPRVHARAPGARRRRPGHRAHGLRNRRRGGRGDEARGARLRVEATRHADVIEPLVERALGDARRRRENRYWRERAEVKGALDEIVGASPAMEAVFEVVRKVSRTNSSVLITGETGTGKELVAQSVHRLSDRAGSLFVPLNCSAIPGELLESELFGHVKGAFSGAHAPRVGKFEAADGGTLFLDEIGDMELRLQAKLLRVLQEGVIEPVGANRRVEVDVRVVSSTNRALEREIEAGQFRSDLFYRLNVVRIELPPLRERGDDVERLTLHFLRGFEREFGKGALELTDEAMSRLRAHRWPGNVRELRNVIERAVVLAEGTEIGADLLAIAPGVGAQGAGGGSGQGADESLADVVAAAERGAIERALRHTKDNKSAAAARLGIGERTLWTKLKKYELTSSDRSRDPEA